MQTTPKYMVMEPALPVLGREPVDDERGARAIITRYGTAQAEIVLAELNKLPALELDGVSGIDATSTSDAVSQAIVSLFDLLTDEDRAAWKAELKSYLTRYDSVDSWSDITITVNGEQRNAHRLSYRSGCAVVAEIGEVFLAISARECPKRFALQSQVT